MNKSITMLKFALFLFLMLMDINSGIPFIDLTMTNKDYKLQIQEITDIK